MNFTTSALGPEAVAWASLAPALAAAAYFAGGLAAYALRTRIRGEYFDAELDTRKSSALMLRWLRMYFAWVTRPLWLVVRRADVPANALTSLSLLLAFAAALLLGFDTIAVGGWLFVGAGILDFLDGRVARARGEAGRRGAALDSVLDRFADAVILIGLAWLYRHTWVLIPTLFALVGSLVISYIRARGEGLGVSANVGLMQRPERIVLLGAALVLTPLLDLLFVSSVPHAALATVLVVLALMTNITAAQRLVHLLRALDDGQELLLWRRAIARGSVSRALIASLAATGADFAVVLALVSAGNLAPWLATALGCVVGGGINFTMGRYWAFHSSGRTSVQASRYLMVSSTSAALNAGAMAILAMTLLDYRLSWLIVRVMVFLGWNYPLHKGYVFDAEKRRGAEHDLETEATEEERRGRTNTEVRASNALPGRVSL